MPVSPAMAEDLAHEVGALYRDAESALLELLARALEADIESPRWAELKLASIGNLRTAVEQVAAALQTDTTGAVRRALVTAYNRGRQAAVAELGALDIGRELVARDTVPNAPAVDRLAASMAEDTRPVYQRITRAVVDTYRRIIGRASGTQLLTGMTRRQASQRALDQFAQQGVTGFIDSMRPPLGDGLVRRDGRTVRDRARGGRGPHRRPRRDPRRPGHRVRRPLECPLCRPWEGEILTLGPESGPHTIRAEKAIQPTGLRAQLRPPETVAVHVAGSLVEARASGLFHPNCRHSLAAYLPGVTTRPPHHPTPNTTYEDTQRQRAIERNIRRWKRVQAAAMDDTARHRAGAFVRKWQAAQRAHVAAHDVLRRKPAREQIGGAR